MDLQGVTTSMAMEVASVKMENKQAQQEGEAAAKLIEAASDVKGPTPTDSSLGANFDGYA